MYFYVFVLYFRIKNILRKQNWSKMVRSPKGKQITFDSWKTQGLGCQHLCNRKPTYKFTVDSWHWFFLHLWIQPTIDPIVLQSLFIKKKSVYKWTHAVKTLSFKHQLSFNLYTYKCDEDGAGKKIPKARNVEPCFSGVSYKSNQL